MGCWAGTCHVSGLPIFEDDEVRFFLLSQADAGDPDFCWKVDDYWRPLGPPILGKYDDYGKIKTPVRSVLRSFYEELVREALVVSDYEYDAETATHVAKPLKKKPSLWNLIKRAERGQSAVKTRWEGDKWLTYTLVLEEQYRVVVDQARVHYLEVAARPDERRLVTYTEIERILRSARPSDKKPAAPKTPVKISEEHGRIIEHMLWASQANYALYGNLMAFLAEPDNIRADPEKVVGEFADYFYFCHGLQTMRSFFYPQVGGGRQDTNTEIRKQVYLKGLERIAALAAKELE